MQKNRECRESAGGYHRWQHRKFRSWEISSIARGKNREFCLFIAGKKTQISLIARGRKGKFITYEGKIANFVNASRKKNRAFRRPDAEKLRILPIKSGKNRKLRQFIGVVEKKNTNFANRSLKISQNSAITLRKMKIANFSWKNPANFIKISLKKMANFVHLSQEKYCKNIFTLCTEKNLSVFLICIQAKLC